MHFSKQAAIAAFAATAHAANFNVQVGQGGGLTFQPQTVNAAVGDTVTFQFAALNHTVTSGDPNTGCAPDGTFNSGFIPIPTAGANAQANGKGRGNGKAAAKAAANGKRGKNKIRGLNNIFEERSLEARQQGGPYNFVYTVRNTDPQVFYCAQLVHCQMGMVGVINPAANGASSLNTYQALSAKAQVNQLPNTAAG
jgi:plastocyanin